MRLQGLNTQVFVNVLADADAVQLHAGFFAALDGLGAQKLLILYGFDKPENAVIFFLIVNHIAYNLIGQAFFDGRLLKIQHTDIAVVKTDQNRGRVAAAAEFAKRGVNRAECRQRLSQNVPISKLGKSGVVAR